MHSDLRTEKQKMLAGDLYTAVNDEEIQRESLEAQEWLRQYNAASPAEHTAMLRARLGTCGEDVTIRAPFACDYGWNIHVGKHTFLNWNCILLDVNPIHIGPYCQIGPMVQIYTADHPRDPALRRQGLESGRPVRIGSNVWIGGGAILLPGITVGDDAIIGAGSIVTRDVPAGATVVGNPARLVTPKPRNA